MSWPTSSTICLGALLAFCTLAAAKTVEPANPEGAAAPSSSNRSSPTALPPAELVFDTTFAPLPPNIANIRFESTGTAEVGDLIRFEGATAYLDSATVTLCSGAIHSDFPQMPASGYVHTLTLKLYTVDRSGATPKAGALIAAVPQNFMIPWRPEPDAASPSPLRPWRAADGKLYNGFAFNVIFDLSMVGGALPGEVIFSVSFDTQHYGSHPLGAAGPYDFLGVGLSTRAPMLGTDVEPDALFASTLAENYADGGRGGSQVFRRDTGWTPYKPAIRFSASARGALGSTATVLRGLADPEVKTDAAIKAAVRSLDAALTARLWVAGSRLNGEEGEVTFSLLADAADELNAVATGHSPTAVAAAKALNALVANSAHLAGTALTDAVLAGGGTDDLSQALRAWSDGMDAARRGQTSAAIDAFGNAWAGAHDAVDAFSEHD